MSKHGYKMATVFFAGLPNALIGLLMNKTTPTVRTERSLLRKKISDSSAPHKDDFLSLLDNYRRENIGGQREHYRRRIMAFALGNSISKKLLSVPIEEYNPNFLPRSSQNNPISE